jgi:hypothetical protein
MTKREMRQKGYNKAAAIGKYKMRCLDDMLQRDRERRHTMGKTEFREKLMMDLGRR